MTERDFAIDVVRQLQEAGHETYFAGGCVRDELLGLAPDDYDVATSAEPTQVRKLFRRTIAVGASFGVIDVLGPRDADGKHLAVQVATFRNDGTYSDGRHPDTVTFSSAKEDAQRRDFTINGMFFDPIAARLIDHVGGEADLKAGVLKAIGDPSERIAEDKLRMLRAVRMTIRFGFRLDQSTRDAIAVMADQIHLVSAERIAEELRKMLLHARRADAVRLLDEVGLLSAVSQFGDPKAKAAERWKHILEVLDGLTEATYPLALAILVHPMGTKRAAKVCRDLKLSNDDRQRCEWLVERAGVLRDAGSLPASVLYPILAHPGARELVRWHQADATTQEGAEYCERVMREVPPEVLDPVPLITGDDLKELGLEPGPKFKRILDAVRAKQLDAELTSKEEAIGFVDDFTDAASR